MARRTGVLLAIGLFVICQKTVAQTAQQGDTAKPNIAATGERQTPQERQRLYERYFVEVCQKDNRCDSDCKAVFDQIDNKANLKLTCP
jgi:hypothetical protein